MRVLHVIPALASRTGGPAFAVVGSALAMRPLGVESTVVTTDLAGAASGERRRVGPDELPPGAAELDVRMLPARRPFRLAFSPALAAAVAEEAARADVVHIHSLYLLPQLFGYRAARKRSRPVRGLAPRRARPVARPPRPTAEARAPTRSGSRRC